MTGKRLAWEISDVQTPGELEAEILAEVTARHDVPLRLVQKLIDVEWQHYGMRRRATIHKAIEKTVGEDWRSLDDVLAQARQQLAPNGTD